MCAFFPRVVCPENVHALEGLAQPQAWSVGEVSAAPCLQGRRRASRSDTRAASQAFSRMLWSQNSKRRPYIATLCVTVVCLSLVLSA
jgi:hypothetical protein